MKVKANGITMNYQVDGPEGAPWLIFSNSLATNLTMWDDQARELKRAYRVLRYDQRGHGGTDVTAGRYSFDLLLADVIALMDALAIKKAHFAGLSMGGQQTLNVGLTNLDGFSQLGVFSSGWFGADGAATFAKSHESLLSDPKINDRIRLFWFATGKDDFVLPSTKASLAMLDQHKIRYSYKETEGGHTWPNWRAYLNEFAPLLFR